MFFKRRAGTRWYDRGDIAAIDYAKEALTADGSWHDLDISGVVGIGKKLVLILADLQDNAGGKTLAVRTKGNTNEINVDICGTQVANKSCHHDYFIETDVNGIIQYNADVATWTTIDLVIRGYFK